MTLQKILMLLLFLLVCSIACLLFLKGNIGQFNSIYIQNYKFSIKEISQVLAIIPFLFVGFDIVPQVLTDIGFNTKFATRMTILATGIGVLIYSLLNIMTAFVYTPAQAQKLDWASGQAVINHLGIIGFIGLSIALFAAIVGGVNGFMIGSSRVLASLGTYQLLPKSFDKLNNNGIPEKSLKFITLISIIMPLLGRIVILYIVNLSSLMAALTYTYVAYVSTKLASTQIEKWKSYIALIISLIFILLLVIPGSPSQLGLPSFIILGIWSVLGIIYFKLNKSN